MGRAVLTGQSGHGQAVACRQYDWEHSHTRNRENLVKAAVA